MFPNISWHDQYIISISSLYIHIFFTLQRNFFVGALLAHGGMWRHAWVSIHWPVILTIRITLCFFNTAPFWCRYDGHKQSKQKVGVWYTVQSYMQNESCMVVLWVVVFYPPTGLQAAQTSVSGEPIILEPWQWRITVAVVWSDLPVQGLMSILRIVVNRSTYDFSVFYKSIGPYVLTFHGVVNHCSLYLRGDRSRDERRIFIPRCPSGPSDPGCIPIRFLMLIDLVLAASW